MEELPASKWSVPLADDASSCLTLKVQYCGGPHAAGNFDCHDAYVNPFKAGHEAPNEFDEYNCCGYGTFYRKLQEALRQEFGDVVKLKSRQDNMKTGNFEIFDEKGVLIHSKKGGAGVCDSDLEKQELFMKIKLLLNEKGLGLSEDSQKNEGGLVENVFVGITSGFTDLAGNITGGLTDVVGSVGGLVSGK